MASDALRLLAAEPPDGEALELATGGLVNQAEAFRLPEGCTLYLGPLPAIGGAAIQITFLPWDPFALAEAISRRIGER